MNETASILIGPALRSAQRAGSDPAASGTGPAATANETATTSQAPGAGRTPLPPPAPGGFRARLGYDHERAEVYIEILDPETGDVVRTLPPDLAAEEYLVLREGGSLVDDRA